MKIKNRVPHLKKFFTKCMTGTAMFFSLFNSPVESFIFKNPQVDKISFEKSQATDTYEKEVILILSLSKQDEKTTYKITGKVFFSSFIESIYWSSDTISQNRDIERKYCLSSKNIVKMQSDLKDIAGQAFSLAFEKIFRITFFDFQANKINYEEIKNKIYQEIKKASSGNLKDYAIKVVKNIVQKLPLSDEEQKILNINYTRYVENLIAIGTASELGLSSPWREYHNKKLAQEVADSVASFLGIKNTTINIYLNENSSNEQLSSELEVFASKLSESSNEFVKKYYEEVKKKALEIKYSKTKEEILNFKEDLRNKIISSQEINTATAVFHWYGVILPEISLKLIYNLPKQSLNYYGQQEELNLFFYATLNNYEEKNGIILPSSTLIKLLDERKELFGRYGLKVSEIQKIGETIVFTLIVKANEIFFNENFKIFFPIYLLAQQNEKNNSHLIYQTIDIDNFPKQKKNENVQQAKILKADSLKLSNQNNFQKDYSTSPKPSLFLQGGSKIFPFKANPKNTKDLQIDIENLKPGSIKNLFSYFYGVGVGLHSNGQVPFDANLIFHPFLFGEVEKSNIIYEFFNKSAISFNAKSTIQKNVLDYEVLISGEGGITWCFSKDLLTSGKIIFGDLNKLKNSFQEQNVERNLLFYGELFAQLNEKRKSEGFYKGLVFKFSFDNFLTKKNAVRSSLDFGLKVGKEKTNLFGIDNSFWISGVFDLIGQKPSLDFQSNSKLGKIDFGFKCGITPNILSISQNRYLNNGYDLPLYYYELKINFENLLSKELNNGGINTELKYSKNFFGLTSESFSLSFKWSLPILYSK
ncbi:MAG: hypothetical protein ACK4J0_02140 [Candidatus Anstonellaceae archaeon]